MARPPKYATEEDKPVSVTLRLPRDLYDQAQQHAKRRQTTLTELVREGLQRRLETPTDPRDMLASQDITVTQELRQMIAEEVQAALVAQRFQAPEAPPTRQGEGKSKIQHYSNASAGIAEATPGTSREMPATDSTDAPTPAPARKSGRPRSAVGQRLLTLLQDHPEGLSAEQLRGYLAPSKPIGDTLAGMRRLGTVQTQGHGRATRYFAAPTHT